MATEQGRSLWHLSAADPGHPTSRLRAQGDGSPCMGNAGPGHRQWARKGLETLYSDPLAIEGAPRGELCLNCVSANPSSHGLTPTGVGYVHRPTGTLAAHRALSLCQAAVPGGWESFSGLAQSCPFPKEQREAPEVRGLAVRDSLVPNLLSQSPGF